MLDALMDNVFSHTPEGSGFTVTIRSVGGRVQLIVDDEGAGFAEGFDPVRGASGRGSTGLGLDIVRRIASEANGSLLIRARADGGRPGAGGVASRRGLTSRRSRSRTVRHARLTRWK